MMKVAPELTKAELADLYRQMKLIRVFEEESSRQYMRGKIRGFLHLYIGEEAKATSSSKGKGGSMHLFDASLRFMGGYAIVARQMMEATLSADHRMCNGTDAAKFINEVKRLLESPQLLMV